jgi:hypothetical protein
VSVPVEMVKRVSPSRPSRLGTRRRRAIRARALAEAGASRRPRPAISLDTEKQLATSVREWADALKSEDELYREQAALHSQLQDTVRGIYLKWASAPRDDAERLWWERYNATNKPFDGESAPDTYRRVEKWLRAKENRPKGQAAQAIKWERTWRQIERCQTEWIAYRASCCEAHTEPIVVPVGCNHRLCPFCAWHRSQIARNRIKTMFDRITHPVLLTLTIPNLPKIRKHDFTMFRQRIRQFLAQRGAWVEGGVYSIETTFNRQARTWHLHAHVLADVSKPLPSVKDAQVEMAGQMVLPFTELKWRLEFDWLTLWCEQWGKRPANDPPKRKKALVKWRRNWDQYRQQFAWWVKAKREHSTRWAKTWTGTGYVLRTDLTPAERELYEAQSAWNAENTRVLDIRPVRDREKAAFEVLKYITKVADFSDSAPAVEAFCDAVKGARLIQTFGSWYGAQFDTVFDPNHLDDWGERHCACGLNCWQKAGVYMRRDVEMDEAGRWRLKRSVNINSRGTVARPTIRGDDPEETDSSNDGRQIRDFGSTTLQARGKWGRGSAGFQHGQTHPPGEI